ncbi:hypothetical protein PybrP1_009609 [[Pythium] brassicae (nom. inval.)]|nr:hypothetical protein PybrP1_009609 [[Pythium] brassicae (nom. inval.)]
MSNWDVNFGEVADHFAELCARDALCASKFPTSPFPDLLKKFVNRNTATGVCAEKLDNSVKSLLGQLLTSESTRGLIPATVYRLERCSQMGYEDSNFRVVAAALPYSMSNLRRPEQDAFNSTLLRNLIAFSEMWETPTLDLASLEKRVADASIATSFAPYLFPSYCMYTRDNSSACSAFAAWRSQNNVPPIAYKRDKYWNTAATIPAGASVLILSGKLDPQTPHKYALRLLAALDGARKELVAFDFASQGTLFNTVVPGVAPGNATCGMSILASYVRGGGDLSKLDKSCVGALKMSFTVPVDVSLLLFSTSEPFDGQYNNSHWFVDSPETERKYVTAFTIVSVATAVVVLVFAYLWIRIRKLGSPDASASGDDAAQCQVVTDDGDAATAHSPSSSGGGQYTAAPGDDSRVKVSG